MADKVVKLLMVFAVMLMVLIIVEVVGIMLGGGAGVGAVDWWLK